MLPELACPTCHADLDGEGLCVRCGYRVPLQEGVYRFAGDTYADSFGDQWHAFGRTQLDSANGTRISEDRFALLTGWRPEDLAGKTVLDVGCGAGRFTEVAIRWGAQVTALDLSRAVFAARANVAGAERARFVQADATAMPFRKHAFDFAFSIGVAQHTPDPLAFVRAVGEAVKPRGRATLWIYERRLTAMLHPRFMLRPLTSRLPPRWNRMLAEGLVDVFFPIGQHLAHLPSPVREIALRALPIPIYVGKLPLPREAHREWSTLDALDWYSPRYDQPQRFDAVSRALRESGAKHVERGEAPLTVRASF